LSINTNFSTLTKAVAKIQNPNLQWGTLIEEIPCDIGRSYEGYKRGGIIEGAEKMRKEVMTAVVWLFGMPAFRALGDKICESVLHVPMAVDFSNASAGNDAIKDSVNFLFTGENKNQLDTSDLKKYTTDFIEKMKKMTPTDVINKLTVAKKATAISALILNCLAMGVVLPKINQKITKNKLKKEKLKNFAPKFDTFDAFKSNTSSLKQDKTSSSNISFGNIFNEITKFGVGNYVTYMVENDNVFRLVSTDAPMIAGRVATSRNKYEGLENFVIDGGSLYFYNFCSNHIQKFLRKTFKVPNINPAVAESIAKIDPDKLKGILNKLDNIPPETVEKTKHLLEDDALASTIYKEATFGRYGKINKFVKNTDIQAADESVINMFKNIKDKCMSNGSFDAVACKKLIKSTNNKNAGFLALGYLTAILGLAVFVPKLAFWITKKITGKNQFTGIADYSDMDKKKEKA